MKAGDRVQVSIPAPYAAWSALAVVVLQGKLGEVEEVKETHEGTRYLVAFDVPASPWWRGQTPATAWWFEAVEIRRAS